VSHQVDRAWMLQAIALGGRGTRAVRPNPKVGCVIVHGDTLVGEGFHAALGGPHAEAVALAQAGERARGATAYVTLEPCNHWGRTPPCAQALIAAGVARVVVGMRDPNRVAAGGLDALAAAGIAIEADVLAEEASDCAEVFVTGVRAQRAFVQLKMAVTADGRVAAEDGTTRWITSAPARKLVHAMRADADAVLIGRGTALADDPQLDCRDLADPPPQLPMRVLLDRRVQLPLVSRLAQTAAQATLLVTDDLAQSGSAHADALRARGVEVLLVPPTADWLAEVLRTLYRRGVYHVLCEGGPTLATALWQAHLVDRLDLLLAPKLLGSGAPWLRPLGIGTLHDARALRWSAVQQIGPDVWLTARPT
jgi:diaminohydroxyphosphoribosylaminopyrimidine deaminase/5-amino-6-(5-phosphoribosylamino)uracil reductase